MNNRILPVKQFQHLVYERADAPFLKQPHGDAWRSWCYREAYDEAIRVANYLQKFPRGSHIAIYSYNCAHWILADLAIWMAGHVSVPIYPTAGKEQIAQILEHSECVAAFIGKLPDFGEKRHAFSHSLECIAMHQSHIGLSSWDDLIRRELPLLKLAEHNGSDIATIVYTSGTTGTPKGVMISFNAIASAGKNAIEWIGIGRNERFFSYLPLAHVAERLVVETGALYAGGSISFAESLETFASNLRATAPTIFLGVPRIWLKFKQAVDLKIPPEKLQLLLAIPLFGFALKSLIRKGMGLHRCRLALSGASPLGVELMTWYDQIGISICEGYAMSENFGYAHFSRPDLRRIGYVGSCLPESETMIAEDGEVLSRSPTLMSGYYKDPILTAETIQNGWLCTGDLGELDESGRLRITGRKKELFKTSKGKYVAPAAIETKLENLAGVEQLCVLGSGLPQPIAIAVVEHVSEHLRKQMQRRLNDALAQINASLESHEKLDRIIVIDEKWTTDNGMMTPTMKLRRQEIERRYQNLVERFSEHNESINWVENNALS